MDHVALLRGVNVGGVTVPMAGLRALAADLGWQNPQTHIASGNLLFSAPGAPDILAAQLEAALRRAHDRDIAVIVLTAAQLRAALAACPFAPDAGKHVHAFFLWDHAVPDLVAYDRLRRPSETLVVQDRIAWLHAPDGIGRSDLAQKIARVLPGVQMTARNLNTVRTLAEMLDARQARC